MEDTFIGGFRGRTIKIREGRGWWAYGKRAPCWKLSCLVNADHYAYSLWRKYTHVTGLITRRLCTRVGPPEIARTYCNWFWWMLIWWVRIMVRVSLRNRIIECIDKFKNMIKFLKCDNKIFLVTNINNERWSLRLIKISEIRQLFSNYLIWN